MCQEGGLIPMIGDAFDWISSKATDLLGITRDIDFSEVDKDLDQLKDVVEQRKKKLKAEREALRQAQNEQQQQIKKDNPHLKDEL
eukprot:CAMPEP_0201545952 /NCGR_PEP_ID=MMETSP0173_2-20130828/2356_1 /ASSEMBLY_ACC=CAM_ASM_000268 /TAXON_ID=218659 /ORGANISM="Vexillifera sp., Strain DIVA3 564/2" /LENGTH=84 /DNA_ID=CAMNT_0047954503 /DNA_START=267 /DNA_END=521 /DNA_ORIENTATION=-